MNLKKIKKNFSRFAAWVGLRTCSLAIKVIPTRYLYHFAWGLGVLGYNMVGKLRKIALESLTTAFGGEKSPEELRKIACDCFIFMAKGAIELMALMDKPDLLKKRVSFSQEENLKAALARGKGVILVSAHFGNFPLMMAKLSLEGYAISGIMRPMHDDRAEKFFLKKRNLMGVKTIYSQPRSVCVQNTLNTLRKNEIVFIPIDQNFGTGGVFVNFFGKKAATATGPAVLARRTQAAILPCFIVRQKDDTHKIIFEPAIELAESGNQQEDVVVNIQRLTDVIERYIRIYPAEWGWVHRRWKSKPNEEEK